jgi:hypothetical protein
LHGSTTARTRAPGANRNAQNDITRF